MYMKCFIEILYIHLAEKSNLHFMTVQFYLQCIDETKPYFTTR